MSQGRPPGSGRPGRRRLAWRSDRPSSPRRDVRDQLGLRIGWVRFWLRAILLGFGLWLIGAALALWRPLQPLVPPFFMAGLILMPAGGLLALLAWLVPLPLEREVRCPHCGGRERVLALPWRFEYICRGCKRHGSIRGGEIDLP